MKRSRTAATAFYDGRLYAALVEPFQRRLHQRLEELIAPGSRVIDACCGAGALPLRLAANCAQVTGVDLSPKQIGFAEQRRRGPQHDHVSFAVANVTDLRRWPDRSFDVAIMVLALHEMPGEERVPALCELARVSRRVIIVDYAVPLPRGPVGMLAFLVEMAAGPRHFRGFRQYVRQGGLKVLMEKAGMDVSHEELLEGNALVLVRS